MTNKEQLMARAKEIMEATLGGKKYKGKENPNSNHTKSELGAKEKFHTKIGTGHDKAAHKLFVKSSKVYWKKSEVNKLDNKAAKILHKGRKHDKAARVAKTMKDTGNHED